MEHSSRGGHAVAVELSQIANCLNAPVTMVPSRASPGSLDGLVNLGAVTGTHLRDVINRFKAHGLLDQCLVRTRKSVVRIHSPRPNILSLFIESPGLPRP